MMPITLDRGVCCDLNETISREWLITNGLGAYASGTVAGVLTRMEHGLLVACPPDTVTPQLLLAKIDEEVVFDQRTYYLGTNEYRDGTLNPSGFVHLETFRLEEGFPVFTYRLGGIDGIVLEKRIWMQQGRNTTCIQYRVVRTTTADESGHRRSGITGVLSSGKGRFSEQSHPTQQPLTLTLLPFTAYRPHNQPQHGSNEWHFQIRQHQQQRGWEEMLDGNKRDYSVTLPRGVAGCTIRAWNEALPYSILAVGQPESEATFIPTGVWYWNFLRRRNAAEGRPALDDLYLPGVIRATLWSNEDATLTIIASTEELATQTLLPNQLNHSYKRSVEGQKQLFFNALQPQRYLGDGGEAAQAQRLSVLPLSTASSHPHKEEEEYLSHLLRACDRFLVHQKLPRTGSVGDHELLFGRPQSIPLLLSDYYSMESRTRDALIALPGITIATGRYSDMSRILRELARHFKRGMLPDTLPLPGHVPTGSEYRSVDNTLWYCYALDHYLHMTHEYELLSEVYPRLVESINWFVQGTCHGIKVDSGDGLLSLSGEAFTWMNATMNGVPVTPRAGKPVEVNALWYHTLSLMNEWSQRLHQAGGLSRVTAPYQEWISRCKESFQQRFWYAEGGYLFDVIDGPTGNDAALRPNQLFAFSLRHPVLDEQQGAPVLDAVTHHLLTPYGLRTLSPGAAAYRGHLGTHMDEQQHALHQGSAWAWLIGPYTDAICAVEKSLGDVESNSIRQDARRLRGPQQFTPFQNYLNEDILGMIGSVFDGDAPHNSGYSLASVLSIAELVRAYHTLTQIRVMQPHHVLSR